MSSLYIHIPFCLKKCKYCDFTSFENCSENLKSEYVKAVIREIEGLPASTFETVFIGGGTPTVLKPMEIEKILQAVLKRHSLSYSCEITIEANPETIGENYAKSLFAMGINRVSLGLQSAQDEVLKAIGRVHSCGRFLFAYESLRKAGFDNINIDLMYGLPNQTAESFRDTLEQVLALCPEHISAYSLILEEGTPMFDEVREGRIKLPDAEYIEEVLSILGNKYQKYEVSNYSLVGKRCKHNLNYWNNGWYFGVGCGAHGCISPAVAEKMGIAVKDSEAIRTEHSSHLREYMTGEDMSYTPIFKNESMFETVMLGLRMVEGINEENFRKRYGVSLYSIIGEYIESHSDLILRKEGFIYLTSRGMDIQNSVLVDLFTFLF